MFASVYRPFYENNMEPSYIPETHGCPFIGIDTDIVYTCYRNEVCCEAGCCTKPFITTFRMCYIWIAIIAIIFACTGGFKYCKPGGHRSERERIMARRARVTSRTSTPESNPPVHCDLPNLELYLQNTPPRLSNLEERVSLRNLLGTTEACHAAIDRYIACRNARGRENANSNVAPPPYHTIGLKQSTYDPYDPPPHYSTVCNSVPVQYQQSFEQATPTTVIADVHTTLSAENASDQIRVTFSGEVTANNNIVLIPTRSLPGIHREIVQNNGGIGNIAESGNNVNTDSV